MASGPNLASIWELLAERKGADMATLYDLRTLLDGIASGEDDAAALAQMRANTVYWSLENPATINNLIVDAFTTRIDDENYALDQALFLDIPKRFEVGDSAGSDQATGDMRAAVFAVVDRYNAAFKTLFAVLDQDFVPDHVRDRLSEQLAALLAGSQSSTLDDLVNNGLGHIADLLREHPIG